MTDITELAQSLENAASKALIEEGLTWFCEEQLSHEDGIALHKADAEFIALANPANILALVEALEKSQQRIDELESRTVKLPAERFCPAEYAGSQLWSETEVWNQAISACNGALHTAGIKVEDE